MKIEDKKSSQKIHFLFFRCPIDGEEKSTNCPRTFNMMIKLHKKKCPHCRVHLKKTDGPTGNINYRPNNEQINQHFNALRN